jgi:hypothetical protein
VVCLHWTEIGKNWKGGQRKVFVLQKLLYCLPDNCSSILKRKAISKIHRLGRFLKFWVS